MTLTFHDYKRDSDYSLSQYNSRRNNTVIRAIKEDLKQHGYDYAIGLIAITVVFAFLVYALPAMAAPMTCSLDYHTGIKVCQ